MLEPDGTAYDVGRTMGGEKAHAFARRRRLCAPNGPGRHFAVVESAVTCLQCQDVLIKRRLRVRRKCIPELHDRVEMIGDKGVVFGFVCGVTANGGCIVQDEGGGLAGTFTPGNLKIYRGRKPLGAWIRGLSLGPVIAAHADLGRLLHGDHGSDDLAVAEDRARILGLHDHARTLRRIRLGCAVVREEERERSQQRAQPTHNPHPDDVCP